LNDFEKMLDKLEEGIREYQSKSELQKIKECFPFLLCYLFNEQKPEWAWENPLIADILWKIHQYTCPEISYFYWKNLIGRFMDWLNTVLSVLGSP